MATESNMLKDLLGNLWKEQDEGINVNDNERQLSIVGGGLLAVYGLSRLSFFGFGLAAVGAGFVYRGLSGHSSVYSALDMSTVDGNPNGNPNATVKGSQAIKVKKSITIDRPADALFTFWRNFENLPRFMNHLESVKVTGAKTSHWVAKAPAGTKVEWDAEIFNEKENELIAWRSLEGADVPNAGSVRFKEAPGGRGTEIIVEIDYQPPAGALGMVVAKLFGEEPNQQVQEGLRQLKQIIEAGESPTTDGQTSARNLN